MAHWIPKASSKTALAEKRTLEWESVKVGRDTYCDMMICKVRAIIEKWQTWMAQDHPLE